MDEFIEEQVELKLKKNERDFYEKAAKYWETIPATVDGMLGGFGFISQIDIRGSEQFLKSILKKYKISKEDTCAVDCGAGIGRITKNLLIKYFDKVDLVEQNPKFLKEAVFYMSECLDKLGELYDKGLQDFCPEKGKYDVIWIQWVLGHLANDDLETFLKNCRIGLKPQGVLILKENVTSSNKIELDQQDSSMTRPRAELKKFFENSGFKLVKEELQRQMPQGLYPVYMFAYMPIDDTPNLD